MAGKSRVGETRVESVTVRLRDLIMKGELPPGRRVTELELASILGVSRTPVRLALGILEGEGMLEGAANRGFTVRRFTVKDVLSSYDVRGVLEGLACRTVAENGLKNSARQELERYMSVGNRLSESGEIDDVDMREWAISNANFHQTIIKAADLSSLSDMYQHLSRLPLASPVAILFRGDRRARAAEIIYQAHQEHLQVFDALCRGESARVEFLMKEHAYRSKRNIEVELNINEAQLGRDHQENTLPMKLVLDPAISPFI